MTGTVIILCRCLVDAIINLMKIRVADLRRIIKEVLEEESWPPGKWYPGHGEPVDPDDVDLMRTGGMGREKDPDESDELKEKQGLWSNVWARRRAGKRPKKPGEKGYPKTLSVEEGDGEDTNQ